MIVERSMHESWLSNAFLLADEPGGTAVFVDSGAPLEPLLEAVERERRHADAPLSRTGMPTMSPETTSSSSASGSRSRRARSRRAGCGSSLWRRLGTRTTGSRSSSAASASRATRSSVTPSEAAPPTRCGDR